MTTPPPSPTTSNADPWPAIVRIASASPSTHNTQGWRLRRDAPDRATLFFSHARTLPAEDRTGAFNVVNMGVFVRALELAAASLGRTLEYDFGLGETDAPEGHTRVAGLRLGGVRPPDAAGAALMTRRRTGRFPYDGRPVPDEDLRSLRAVVEPAGHRFGWTHDPELIGSIMELNADTIADDLQERPIREEVRAWTRFTRRQAERTGDGLWAACMNQGPLGLWLTYRFPWVLRAAPVRRAASKRDLASQGGTATIAWISGAIEERWQQLETGRMMLDWWLRLTERGVAMLPYGSLYTRRSAYREVAGLIGEDDWWIVVRLGYGPAPPRSFRLAPEALWIGEGS